MPTFKRVDDGRTGEFAAATGSSATAPNRSEGGDRGLEAKLWQAANARRNNMDAAEYKHVVLGLIFLKDISDAFEEQHPYEVETQTRSSVSDTLLPKLTFGELCMKDAACSAEASL